MKNLLPFILTFLIPGLGHLYLKDYKKGLIILFVTLVGGFFIPIIPYAYIHGVCLIWALVDIYLTLEKIEGRPKIIRSLIFSLVLVWVILPSIIYLFFISLNIGKEYVKSEYFNLPNTKYEMKEISLELDRYFGHYKKYPSDFKSFVRSKPIWSSWENDGWENNYRYSQKDSIHYLLISSGKDCKFDTDDDIRIENN